MTLRFPWDSPPEHGSTLTIAPGIDWVRLPLPFRLDHVNCWWLDDGREAVQIDTGIASDKTRALWTSALGRDPDALLVTHFHPDHAGMTGEYAARQVALYGSEIEMRLSARIHRFSDADYGELYASWYTQHGLSGEVAERALAFGNGYGKIVSTPAPLERFRLLDAGDTVTLAGREWQVMIGRGHAPAMLMLFNAADKLLIAADQVLPSISPNVSVGPSPAPGVDGVQSRSPFGVDEPDPLGRFLETLASLQALPEDTLVLPSHGVPFHGLHQRLDELARHHADRLSAVLDACAAPTTAAELFPVLFGKRMDAQQMSFALGEALAHAEHLAGRGELSRQIVAGVVRFQRR